MNKIKKKHGTNGEQNNCVNIELPTSTMDRSITPRSGNMFSNQSNPRHKYFPSTSTTPRI